MRILTHWKIGQRLGLAFAICILALLGLALAARVHLGDAARGAASLVSAEMAQVSLLAQCKDQINVVARGVRNIALLSYAEEKLAEEKKAAQTKLALKNLEELGRHEPALRKELQEALNRTYRRALEAKARELGEVESLQEQGRADGTYEVTVVVKA